MASLGCGGFVGVASVSTVTSDNTQRGHRELQSFCSPPPTQRNEKKTKQKIIFIENNCVFLNLILIFVKYYDSNN